MESFKCLGELIENSGHIAKILLAGEIAMNDGDLALSQKCTIEAQNLIKVMLDDVFQEVVEEFGIQNDECVDYDLPTTLELARVLSEMNYNAGVLINLILDKQSESVVDSVKTKIIKDINTVKEIATAIFFN